MRHRASRISSLVPCLALLAALAGCSAQLPGGTAATPAVLGAPDAPDFGDAVSPRYQTLSAQSPIVTPLATAVASSVRDARWWDVTNVLDGNVHSAWSPADGDEHPTLTLTLPAEVELTGLTIKMDQSPIAFDVAVAAGGDFETIATDVKPQYQALDFVPLPSHRARTIRLSFKGIGAVVGSHNGLPTGARLFVCEAHPQVSAAPPLPVGCGVLSSSPLGFFATLAADGKTSREFRFNVLLGAGGPSGTVQVADLATGPVDYQVESLTRSTDGQTLTVTASHDGTRLVLTAQVVATTGDNFKGFVTEERLTRGSQLVEDLLFPTGPRRPDGEIDGSLGLGACLPTLPLPQAPGTLTTIGRKGAGFLDGPAADATFSGPWGIATDAAGRLFIADNLNDRIRMLGLDGQVITFAGTGAESFADGPKGQAAFNRPNGLAFGPGGVLYVSDTDNNRIRAISPAGAVTTLVGGLPFGFADGPLGIGRMSGPVGLAVDAQSNVYFTDTDNNRIRKVTPDGTLSTIAGSGDLPTSTGPGETGYVDGPGASAKFNQPIALAFDHAGRLLVADWFNNRIRAIAPDGTVSTVAGDGTAGLRDGADPLAAEFDHPSGLAVGADGTVYVADFGNGKVRTLSPDGHVATLAMGAGSSIAIDAQGHLYTTFANQLLRRE